MILERLFSATHAASRRFGISGRGALGDFWFQNIGPTASSGEKVTPSTALTLSAYWACIANISSDIARLPLPVFSKDQDGNARPHPGHAVHTLLNKSPNAESLPVKFRQTLTQWALGWGNGYAEIERNGIGRPTALNPIHPSRVTLRRDDRRRMYYEVSGAGHAVIVAPANMLHIPGRLSDDTVCGLSIASAGCESIGRALAVQRHSAGVFAGGGTQRVALKHPSQLDEQSKTNLRNSWMQLYSGNNVPAVLDKGLDVAVVGIKPQEAQMLEAMQFTVEDLARWFRCPPHIIQYLIRAQGWSTLEMQSTEYVIFALMEWAVTWEQEIYRKLFMSTEQSHYCRHNFDSLMRGDSKTRAEFYDLMTKNGFYTINDVLRLEDRNPIGPEGDIRFVQGNNVVPLASFIRAENGEEVETLKFKRELVKAMISDGTLSDVIFNLTEGKKLLEEVNITTHPGAAEPWLPVLADNGQPVTGEVRTDSEGDIVGGVAEESEPEEPVGQTGEDQQDAADGDDDEPVNGEAAVESQGAGDDKLETRNPQLETIRAAALAALDHEFHRALRREIKSVQAAVRKTLLKGDRDGFETWTANFYEGWREELAGTVAPAAQVLFQLGDGQFEHVQRLCDSYSTSSKAQILAVLRDEGPDGVTRRLAEWEQSRTFEVTHGKN